MEAARGSYAFHAIHGSTYAVGNLRSWAPFPMPHNRFWLRMFVYLSALPTDFGPYTFASLTNITSAVGGLRFGGISNTDGSNVLLSSLYSPSVSLQDSGEDAQLTAGEWMCLELNVDGMTDETRVFWNNVERPALHATPDIASTIDTGNFWVPEIDYIDIGFGSIVSTVIDAWIDSVANGPERIGCEN